MITIIKDFLINFFSNYLQGHLKTILGLPSIVIIVGVFSKIIHTTISINIIIFSALVVGLLLVLYLYLKLRSFRQRYVIPINENLHPDNPYIDDIDPLSRGTKWNYKDNKHFYYIPLLVMYIQGERPRFTRYCGPFCAKCDHLLRLKESSLLSPRFFCVNCVKNYKIPSELLGEYDDKLHSYFKEEYRKGHLKNMSY